MKDTGAEGRGAGTATPGAKNLFINGHSFLKWLESITAYFAAIHFFIGYFTFS